MGPILSFADFRVDAPNGRLWRGDEPLTVPPKVLSVLHHLAERPQQLVTKADLFARVWPETAVGDAVLTVAIGEIRKLLGDDPRTPRFIETVHRRGYRFIAPVNHAVPEAPIAPSRVAPTEPPRRDARPSGKPNIVGRDAELAYLHDLLRCTLDGEPQVVFVTGAAGLGKTTLVDAFLEQVAASEKVWIAKGQCLEHYGAGEAFLPVFEALGNLSDEVAPSDFVPLLRRFAPSWLAQMPRLLDADDFSLLLRTTAGVAPERRLREMLDALEELSARAPLLLVLEDLHWSDYSTIDLLAALARRRSAARLLVLGTHRPADLAAQGHPLLPLTQELLARRQCRELALELLSEPAVGAYLAERFAQNHFPTELSSLLQERTDGHPLFMVHLVDDWVEGEQLTCAAGSWEVDGSLDRLRSRLPASLRALVEQHAGRCTEDEQRLVAAASVVGDEFAIGPVAAALEADPLDVERGCESLVRRDLLERRSLGRAASGELVSRYGFRHAVYRNVLYESIPIGQRQQWHRRIAQAIERESGGRAGEVAAELALHFEQGRDAPAAVRHLAIAAQGALLCSAHREAVGYLRRGLAAVSELPDGPERDQSELVLRVCLGVALSATQGYASPEVEETYTRALELCRSRGGSSELFSTLHGLCRFYGVRADFGVAIEVGDELYRHAEEQGTPELLVEASWAKGTMLVYRGELDAARRLLEQGASIYAPEQHGSHAFAYGQDPGVACLSYLSWVSLVTGSLDRALEQSRRSLELARDLGHPFTLAFALHHATLTHQQRGDRDETRHHGDELVALATKEEFPFWQTMGSIALGGELVRDGRLDEGLDAISQGIALHRAFGADIGSTYWLALLAETHARRGAREEALEVVDRALSLVETGQERLWEAEIHRLRGDVLLGSFGAAAAPERRVRDEAAACFGRALDVARAQGAKLWELRAATRLARLPGDARARKRALDPLATLAEDFTEGRDAADVREATTLLSELWAGAPPRRPSARTRRR